MTMRILIGDFEIEPAIRRLRGRGGAVIHLANRPFQVLLHLIAHRDRLVTRAELLELFWDGRDVYEDALTRCVSSVRKALGDQDGRARYIETRWAGGYRFIGPYREIQPPRLTARESTSVLERLLRRGNSYLANCGYRSHRYALEMFSQANALAPEDARTYGGIAASHALLFMHAEPVAEHRAAATASSQRALDIDIHQPEVQLGRALVALMDADHDLAHEAFEQAEQLDPGMFSSFYYHARGCAQRNDHDGALKYFMLAAKASPDDYQGHALAEQSFERLGLMSDARCAARSCVSAAERALRRNPGDVRALSIAACTMTEIGREDEARGWTERAIALEPQEPYVNYNAACAFIALGDHDRALHHFGRVPFSARGNYNWLAQDPCLDPVRSDPRFTALLAAQV